MFDLPADAFKSASDPSIPYFSFKTKIGISEIKKDCLNEFGMICKTIIINNFDSIGKILVTVKDPNDPQDIIPPSTKGSLDQWVSFVDVIPDAVTGNGILELQLVTLENARKLVKTKQEFNAMLITGMML